MTAANTFPNVNRRWGREVTNRRVPRQEPRNRDVKLLRKGLGRLKADPERREQKADSANPKQGAKEVRGKGENRTSWAGVNDEWEQEPHGGKGEGPRKERRGGGITLLGQSHQGGGEGGVEELRIISLVLRFQLPEVYRRWLVGAHQPKPFILFYFIFKWYVHCFYSTKNSMHLIDVAKTKPEIK